MLLERDLHNGRDMLMAVEMVKNLQISDIYRFNLSLMPVREKPQSFQ